MNGNKVILAGAPSIYYKSDTPIKRRLVHLLESFNLHTHVNVSTHIIKNSATIIDYVCSIFQTKEIHINVCSAYFTDHEVVLFKFPINNVNNPTKQTERKRPVGKTYFLF